MTKVSPSQVPPSVTFGSVTGSVSKKTDYLVNNDIESTSSKNQKAKSLGIPIISEDMFVERFGK